jgi:hypothetical protein
MPTAFAAFRGAPGVYLERLGFGDFDTGADWLEFFQWLTPAP